MGSVYGVIGGFKTNSEYFLAQNTVYRVILADGLFGGFQ